MDISMPHLQQTSQRRLIFIAIPPGVNCVNKNVLLHVPSRAMKEWQTMWKRTFLFESNQNACCHCCRITAQYSYWQKPRQDYQQYCEQ